jgi:hypothetical protein
MILAVLRLLDDRLIAFWGIWTAQDSRRPCSSTRAAEDDCMPQESFLAHMAPSYVAPSCGVICLWTAAWPVNNTLNDTFLNLWSTRSTWRKSSS